MDNKGLETVFSALKFAAEKHRSQKRKDNISPYINHPIDVVEMMIRCGKVDDPIVLAAGLLHDTVEDTGTKEEELKEKFGSVVAGFVMECTDDKSLPKARRKELQVEHAPHKSAGAKTIKIADKISNIKDIMTRPPADWTQERIVEYLSWAEKVVAGLRGGDPGLEELFDKTLADARAKFDPEK